MSGTSIIAQIFVPLRQVLLVLHGFLYIETHSTVQKLGFDDRDTMCVHLLLIV